MNFNIFLKDDHLKFPKDDHALFSASNYHWTNYTIEKMMEKFSENDAKKIGTDMHELACRLIQMKVKLPNEPHTFNMYVNDCILHGMYPEKQLMYSQEFRGTADALTISPDNELLIFDLKTGKTKASMRQLEIYAALFFLDFGCEPRDVGDIILRIYQNNEIMEKHPEIDEIVPIMDKIVTVDTLIKKIKEGR